MTINDRVAKVTVMTAMTITRTKITMAKFVVFVYVRLFVRWLARV